MNIESDATLSGPALGGSESIGTVNVDLWVYSIGLGFRF